MEFVRFIRINDVFYTSPRGSHQLIIDVNSLQPQITILKVRHPEQLDAGFIFPDLTVTDHSNNDGGIPVPKFRHQARQITETLIKQGRFNFCF